MDEAPIDPLARSPGPLTAGGHRQQFSDELQFLEQSE
jgi:hypothetical protein